MGSWRDWTVYERCLEEIPIMSVATVIAGNTPTYFLRYSDVALLSKRDFEANPPTTSL